MILGAVPLYNVYAVLVLTVECPQKGASQDKTLLTTLKGIVTNPIILSIFAGVILSATKVQFPKIIDNTIGNFARIVATFFKLIGWAMVFLPIAVWLGYRDEKLMALVIMLTSPTTPSCYIMAKSMKSEGTLTSSVVVLTTLCSAFTLTAIIFVLKSLGLL